MIKNLVIGVLFFALVAGVVLRNVESQGMRTEIEELRFADEYRTNLFNEACKAGKQCESALNAQALKNKVMHTGYHAILYPMNIYTAVDAKTGEVEVLDSAPPSDHPLIRVSPEVIRSAPKAEVVKPKSTSEIPPGDCREVINRMEVARIFQLYRGEQ